MINPFANEPAGSLPQWLRHSLAWTAACVGCCSVLWYFIIVQANAMCVSCGTSDLLMVLTPALLLGQWLAFEHGLSRFKQASAGTTSAPASVEIVAYLWYLLQIVLHFCWGCLNFGLLLCTLLSLGDDSPGFSWG